MKKLVLLFFFISFSLRAQGDNFSQALKAFHEQQFDEMVGLLEKTDVSTPEQESLKAYMLGIGYNRVEDYHQAVNSFGRALLMKNRKPDIFYEMGQAYYALNELKVSKDFFVKSYNLGFKKVASLYYLGHISELLGDDKAAKSYYLEISKSPNADANLKQIATYQLAEIIYKKFQGSNYLVKRVLRRYVFPLYDEAKRADPNSDLALEIANRKEQLIRQFKMDVYVMRNGREVSKRQWSLLASQEAKYDDNVTYAADNPAQSMSTKESSIYSDTMVTGSYNFIPNTSMVVTPSFKVKNQKYFSNVPSVYSNDSQSFEGKLTSSLEHSIFDRPASFLLTIGYDYKKRDYLEEKSPAFYGETYFAEVAEKLRLFGEGDTQFRVQYKDYKGYSETQDTSSVVFDIYNSILLFNKHYFITFLQYDMTSSDVASNESTSTTLSLNYYIPRLYKRLDFTLSYAFTMTDTDLKGTEYSQTPSIELAQNLGNNWQLSFSSAYTKNSAEEETYTYSKLVTALGVRFSY